MITKPPQFSAAVMAEALRRTRGIYSAAAEQVGCNRETVANYVRRYESVRQAAEEGRSVLVDAAEGQLWTKVEAGEWPAIAFVLTTLGKERGYAPAQRHEVSGPEGAPIPILLGVHVVDDRPTD